MIDVVLPMEWPEPIPPTIEAPPMQFAQPVTITDRLVRVELTPAQVLALAERWEHTPTALVEHAGKVIPRLRAENWHREYRTWIPASLLPALGWDVRVVPRAEPRYLTVEFPLAGIVTQRVQLQDGRVQWAEGEGATFLHAHTGTGYRVAYSINRRPVLVHPSMIEEES